VSFWLEGFNNNNNNKNKNNNNNNNNKVYLYFNKPKAFKYTILIKIHAVAGHPN